MKSLAIRADASTAIGLGHAMRCLALAQEARDRGWTVLFLSTSMPPTLSAALEAEGVEVRLLSCETGSPQDARETTRAARAAGSGWIVVDGYRLGGEYQHALKRERLHVLAIDDFGQMTGHRADLILDQNLGATPEPYAGCPKATLLLGPEFAMLRRAFRARPESKTGGTRLRILVTMGGADPVDATLFVVKAIESLEVQAEKTVIVGSAYPHLARLEAAITGSETRLEVNPADMAMWMHWADLAISAGGSTSWELACAGVPAVVVPFAANQIPIARALAGHGVARFPGPLDSIGPDDLRAEVNRLAALPGTLAEMSLRARRLIDGWGARRVLDAIIRFDHNARGTEASRAPGTGLASRN